MKGRVAHSHSHHMEASLLEDLDDDDSPAPVQHEVDVDPVESPNNGGASHRCPWRTSIFRFYSTDNFWQATSR